MGEYLEVNKLRTLRFGKVYNYHGASSIFFRVFAFGKVAMLEGLNGKKRCGEYKVFRR